jgi:hypothetical protein
MKHFWTNACNIYLKHLQHMQLVQHPDLLVHTAETSETLETYACNMRFQHSATSPCCLGNGGSSACGVHWRQRLGGGYTMRKGDSARMTGRGSQIHRGATRGGLAALVRPWPGLSPALHRHVEGGSVLLVVACSRRGRCPAVPRHTPAPKERGWEGVALEVWGSSAGMSGSG